LELTVAQLNSAGPRLPGRRDRLVRYAPLDVDLDLDLDFDQDEA
jgi:hypothetical protein